ncbi:MAG: hypothetical protein GY711_01025 [bacterium]|nr:hypothetical protein [bacterium]
MCDSHAPSTTHVGGTLRFPAPTGSPLPIPGVRRTREARAMPTPPSRVSSPSRPRRDRPPLSASLRSTETRDRRKNDEDYTLGDRIDVTAWAARMLSDRVSVSARLAFADWDDIDGENGNLNPMLVPTADPDLRGGQRVDLSVGLNDSHASGNRLALEFGAPIEEDLDGPQLSTDWIATVGWQLAF